MEANLGDFFVNFLSPFFQGIVLIIKGLGNGILKMFNVIDYIDIINNYKVNINGAGWLVVILTILCLLSLFAFLIFIIIRIIKRYVNYRKNLKNQDSFVDEIELLNTDIIKLKNENKKFMELTNPETGEVEYDEEGNPINKLKVGESRFFKLSKIDEEFKNYVAPQYNTTISLNELCERFRNYSASRLHLYYDIDLIRLFISAFASNRLIILQGISGTGKTSLAYAFGNFIQNDAVIASVQPSWRDNTELFGYFNEFTKKFNESEVLKKMYEALYKKDVYITVLDEMNISRVEYYFAEMLSVLELPVRDEWKISLVSSVWDSDPEKLKEGKITIPDNMWYIGTINNDDSTFMVTDKVYDRAMPIEINTKTSPFTAQDTDAIFMTGEYFESLFKKAQEEKPVSNEIMQKIDELDNYLISHFRLSFGNRIVKQLKDYVPAFVSCGGEEIRAVDYVIAHKILRKFEQLNMSYVRNELDGFILFLDKTFGKDNMKECKEYVERVKKTI